MDAFKLYGNEFKFSFLVRKTLLLNFNILHQVGLPSMQYVIKIEKHILLFVPYIKVNHKSKWEGSENQPG